MRLATSPDGNGDVYGALKRTGMLDVMAKHNVQHVFQYSVDNLLVKMCDPLFIGFCISRNASVGCKTVEKSAPTEPVGVVCLRHGRPCVVEYSEISRAEAGAVSAATGRLLFSAAHLCINYFSRNFLVRAAGEDLQNTMFHHVAKKAIASLGGGGRTMAWKLEQYIFDMFPNADKLVVLQARREEEFAPVKNADGTKPSDTPTTARHMLSRYHKLLIERAGGTLVSAADSCEEDEDRNLAEISPLVSYEGEGLGESLIKYGGESKVLKLPLLLQ